MRLSSTPPNNFSKVSVNQPASLQQRQGLDLNPKEASKLAFVTNRAQFNVVDRGSKLVKGRYKQTHWRDELLITRVINNYYQELMKNLAAHDDPFTGRVVTNQSLTDIDLGNIHTLEICKPNGDVLKQIRLNARTFAEVIEPLEDLLEDLPRLAEEHASNG
jgi:hypothetical protein